MKKIIFLSALLLVVLFQLHAQSINNTNWKAYFGEPFNDSLTLHVRGDSSFVSRSNGEVLVQTKCVVKGDTLTLSDYSTGPYSCPGMTGTYKIDLKGDNFTATLIDDACEGRAQALNGVKWTKAPK